MATKVTKKNTPDTHNEVKWPYGKKNYIFFGAALLVIIIGFFMLSQGDETLAPILLVVGYLILIPIALMLKDDSVTEETTKTEISE